MTTPITTPSHQDAATSDRARQARRASLHTLGAALAVAGSGALSPRAQAQSGEWPNKPIRLVVGYPPGGSGDFTTRTAADELSKELNVSVLAENRPGAGGTIANELVSKAAPDGYTVLNAGPMALTNSLYRKLGYDSRRDFVPVCQLAVGPMIICVNNDLPVRTLADLIAYAKAHPGKLNSAASGNGSTPHLAAALFESVAGVQFTTIQFKGGAPAATSTIAGDTHVMFATPPTVMGFLKAGRMRALAVTTPQASAAIPGIPGAAEAGLSGYESTFSFGLYLPSAAPASVVRALHAATVKAMARPGVREKVAGQGMDVATSASPEDFARRLAADAPSIERAVKVSGAKIE
jgi:tripartite-type tricarboxylate transporter receptor subunit TctC